MAKYHVNEKGEAGPCRARKQCPFGDLTADHYASPAEAREAYERSMKASTFASQTPSTLTTEDLKRFSPEKQRLLVGATRSVTTSFLAREEKARWQALYDSTEVGEKWFARKAKENARHPEMLTRKRHLEELLATPEDEHPELSLPEDPGDVLDKDFTTAEDHVFWDKNGINPQKVKLALLSAAWMSNLSADETEAIAWVTSNGASVINDYLNGNESIWGYETYPKPFIHQQLRLFRSAMAKAPELDEPVIIYRGTGADHAETAYLDRPASASASGAVAKSFDNGEGEHVLLEIKTRKVPAAVGMSTYGSGELEVLAPLGSYRKVGEFEAHRGREDRSAGQPAIDPEFDRIRVIQLEYVG